MMSDLASPRSPGSADLGPDDFDYDEDHEPDLDDSREFEDRDTDEEDSEAASEDEEEEDEHDKEEYSGIKEQMYQDKLAQLKKQLQLLRENTHPEYNKKLKKVDALYRERLRLNDLWREVEMDCVEKDHQLEKRLAGKEFEEKKKELKENLLLELEDKKKIIEQERYTLELTGDSMESYKNVLPYRPLSQILKPYNGMYKPVSTRKLRRRGNEPPPVIEKRRKPVANTLQLLLDERQVEDDLKLINKSKLTSMKKTTPSTIVPHEIMSNEPKIENGKLYFDKKWFRKGQPVMIECKDGTRFHATLTVATNDTIVVRKTPDNIRLKISLAQLAHGKYLVRRGSAHS